VPQQAPRSGTSFAAVSLVRDTDTSSNTELTDKHTHEVLNTLKSAESFEFERTTIAPDGRLRLCAVDGINECEINVFRTMISKSMCDKIINHCSRGNIVNLKRAWKNGEGNIIQRIPLQKWHNQQRGHV